MTKDGGSPEEVDLERTDRLPVLSGISVDDDVADDAVRIDFVPAEPSVKSQVPVREALSPVDEERRVEELRRYEARIDRLNAEYESLGRSYQKACDGETAALSRAQALAAELATVRTGLEIEQGRLQDGVARARQLDTELAAANAAIDAARVRSEEAARDIRDRDAQVRGLRESLGVRDASIAQLQHSLSERDAGTAQLQRSLAERDAQLSALQREHAKVVPELEERSSLGTQLQADLHGARARAEALDGDLTAARESVAEISARLKTSDANLESARHDLRDMTDRAAAHFERLQTRDWRQGFEHNLFRELDSKVGAAHDARGTLQSESEQLRQRIAALEGEIAKRDLGISDALAAGNRDAQHHQDLLAAATAGQAELSAQIERLRTDARARADEIATLMAQLRDARRPADPGDGEVRRLRDEVAAKRLILDKLGEDNRALRAAQERIKAELAERDFLIRRLERSDSGPSHLSGRLPAAAVAGAAAPGPAAPGATTPGATTPGATTPGATAEFTAELLRIDGPAATAHVLARRTRIGRAPGCELQVESTSVSRHHALVVMSSRDVIIEDTNSTNGVLVNGRKISRQLLNDGDVVGIGEVQFRFSLRIVPTMA